MSVWVLNGFQAVTGDGEKFGFAVYVPAGNGSSTSLIQIAGDLPDELEEYCGRVENRESVEKDFYLGNLFHEFTHHLQWCGYRTVNEDMEELDAEEFGRELYDLYETEKDKNKM